MNTKHGLLLLGIGLLLICMIAGTASAKVIMCFELDNPQVDTTPPVLHDIWVTPSVVTSGEAVTVYVNASDDLSGIDMVFPMFLSPSGGQHLQFGGCDYNSSSGLWEKGVTIPLYAENGTWIVDLVDLRDNAENYERYDYGTDYFANFTVNSLTPENQPPAADFIYSPEYPIVNLTITFNASASYDPDGSIVSYNWSFGDGNMANIAEAMITHSYASAGEYIVNLTVTDDEGATNQTSQQLRVFSNVSYFDTEPGTYPSISGTHNGTIKMTHTVNVSRIYLYPSTGTGGHLEYAKIWNTSWSGAEAHWNGYVGDWHNCSFDTNFTLIAGETYNYTIRTGSYPQIHHQPELLTAKGGIKCTSFVDANGKTYTDWIPAIRLE